MTVAASSARQINVRKACGCRSYQGGLLATRKRSDRQSGGGRILTWLPAKLPQDVGEELHDEPLQVFDAVQAIFDVPIAYFAAIRRPLQIVELLRQTLQRLGQQLQGREDLVIVGLGAVLCTHQALKCVLDTLKRLVVLCHVRSSG